MDGQLLSSSSRAGGRTLTHIPVKAFRMPVLNASPTGHICLSFDFIIAPIIRRLMSGRTIGCSDSKVARKSTPSIALSSSVRKG